ncbi:UDP-glucose/GDP-mannose dehydrogenase family, NAD binding domain [Aquamicrobium aerolatum DSM 21857]|uniref:UDP-glucose 6-dehydrogenase n=1 Tax=Aquamicrobium aerolatum DSM 21857 TaxID=1121003 RepID=A0A1I3I8D9_9HYPH|nr:UDP-glucose/GDP-mannose dehydrogenase family, NAD binding domain [Aquamicrobium aerolatum DSM 21857]
MSGGLRIAIVGTGYVGLVSGVCLAEMGHFVTCVDQDAARIALLGDGIIPIHEPGLGLLAAKNRVAGRLQFSKDLAGSVANADVVFIAVGDSIASWRRTCRSGLRLSCC